MLRNYLTGAIRNLQRHRSYSINSILSLAVSLVVCLLVLLLLYDQWQYDRHHERADRIYRVVSTSGSGNAFASSPAPLRPVLQERFTGVEATTRVTKISSEAIIEGARLGISGLLCGALVFELFDWPIQAGAAPQVLEQPAQSSPCTTLKHLEIRINGFLPSRFAWKSRPEQSQLPA